MAKKNAAPATEVATEVVKKPKTGKGQLPFKNVPEHIARVSVLLIHNAELRRFTAIGIRNYLIQKGMVKEGSVYIKFLPSKFAVNNNGLNTEYSYTEQFFLNSLVAAFPSFAASANKAIDNMCRVECETSADALVDKAAVEAIVESNVLHIDQQPENLQVEE